MPSRLAVRSQEYASCFATSALSLAGLTRNNFCSARCDQPSLTFALMPSAPRRKRTARTERPRRCAILFTGSYPAQSNSRPLLQQSTDERSAGSERRRSPMPVIRSEEDIFGAFAFANFFVAVGCAASNRHASIPELTVRPY